VAPLPDGHLTNVSRPRAPAYGTCSLAELLPAALAAVLGRAVPSPQLRIPSCGKIVVLLVDGLGHSTALRYARSLPRLHAGLRGHVSSAFPCSTSVCLATLGTGAPPGTHGFLGFNARVRERKELFNYLSWASQEHIDEPLTEDIPPEVLQPRATVFERAERQGVATVMAGPSALADTPYTRAIFRGAQYAGADEHTSLGDTILNALARLDGPALVYGYHPDLDRIGHEEGLQAPAYLDELGRIDALVGRLADALAPDETLVVVADHGMVELRPKEVYELADHAGLEQEVELLGGEARARHVYTEPGAAQRVATRWRDFWRERMWVGSREQAVAFGLFGTVVPEHAERIGDVVAIAAGPVGIVDSRVLAAEARMRGHHGALSHEERLVPIAVFGGRRS